MDTNFEVPEINVTPFSATDNAGTSGGDNQLPILPFSNRENDLDILDF